MRHGAHTTSHSTARFLFELCIAVACTLPAMTSAATQCQHSSNPPAIDWTGKRVLWLGTSIPHQGIGSDSYPELFCRQLGCIVKNNAFSGSHMRWLEHARDESCRKGRNAPKGLTATNRELRQKITSALPDDGSSSYHETCNRATRPMQMGFEHRINAAWQTGNFDVVVIDHGHNDRPVGQAERTDVFGTLNPPDIPIASINKGTVTEIVFAREHGLKVFDDITLRTPGIARMDYWTGEVLEIAANRISVRFDSSNLPGEYVGGGSAIRHDKTKLYDAYNLIISDIRHMNAFHGGHPVQIVLVTPPTEWTHGRNDGSIAAVNRALRDIALKWALPLYDMTRDLDIGKDNLLTYLPDGAHPTTHASRKRIADHLSAWALGKRCP